MQQQLMIALMLTGCSAAGATSPTAPPATSPTAPPAGQTAARNNGARNTTETAAPTAAQETPVTVEISGVLSMDPAPMGKGFQGTWVDTGTERLLLGYRPIPEYFPFQNKRVVAHGERWMPGPYEQHVGAMHFRVASLELAPGEAPNDPIPTEVLAPPFVQTTAELRALNGRWANVLGEVSGQHPDEHGWLNAEITLSDGATYAIDRLSNEFAGEGARTVLCVVMVDGDVVSLGPVASCPGRAPRCGMDAND